MHTKRDREEIMNEGVFCPVGKAEKLLLATDSSIYSEGAIREAISFKEMLQQAVRNVSCGGYY